MRFANSADWKSNLGKHYQPPSSSANAPEIVALADLGSQPQLRPMLKLTREMAIVVGGLVIGILF